MISWLTSSKEKKSPVLIHGYRGLEHSADPQEIDDVETYLNERVPPVGDKQTL